MAGPGVRERAEGHIEESTTEEDVEFLTPDNSLLGHPNGGFGWPPGILAYRYWTSGCLRYEDDIPDRFYDLGCWRYPEFDCLEGEMPSLQKLREILPAADVQREIVVVDHSRDPVCAESPRTYVFF
jgi:hypothetical protein